MFTSPKMPLCLCNFTSANHAAPQSFMDRLSKCAERNFFIGEQIKNGSHWFCHSYTMNNLDVTVREIGVVE